MDAYKLKITDWPESERPRERLVKYGAQSLSDAEILAIILRVGNHKKTAIDLARSIIKDLGGFSGLDTRSIAELCQVNGIGPAKATQIKAAIELGKRLSLEENKASLTVECSDDVYKIVGPHMENLDREIFKILLLTSRNSIILNKDLFQGSLTESLVSPREIIKEALNHAAASIVFIHNHPSGDPSPSEEDKTVTRRLKSACDTVGIKVLDHIIIGKRKHFSFADEGLL